MQADLLDWKTNRESPVCESVLTEQFQPSDAKVSSVH